MAIVAMRIENCGLEVQYSGDPVWYTVGDLTNCVKGTIKAGVGGAGVFVQQGDEITTLTQIDNYYDGRQYYTYIGRTGTDDAIKCLAALNAVNVFSKLHYEVTRKYGVVGGLTGAYVLAAAIMLVLGTPIGGFVFETAADLAYIGLAMMWPSNFTTTVQREFACILKNRATVNSEGVVSFDYNTVVSDVQAKRTFYPSSWDALYGYLRLLNVDGLNIAGDTREITSTCCNFCDTTLQVAELYLGSANDYWGAVAFKTATNNNTIVKDATGIQINANGNTLYGGFQFMLNVPVGCEIVTAGLYVPSAGEPINSIVLSANGAQMATWANRRPFGAFTYAAATTQAGTIKLQWSAYNNNTTSGYFRLERVYVQYRGCSPFATYV